MTPTPNDSSPPTPQPVPPELLAWAQQTLDVEAVLREVSRIETSGGCTLESFIDELESRAIRRE